MPDANPLVAESKKDGDGPGPFTEGNGDYGYATGINIAESATDAWKGIADGDWVSGGLGVASLAGEIAGAAIDPFGYLMSSVASFLMEHVQPLKDMLDSVAGNPPVIQSYADTWGNVAKALQERQKDLENAVKTGTAEWKGDGADAYRKSAAEAAEAIGGAATVANAIGTVTMIMGQVVAFVRGLVRQLIADLVGKLISWVMEEVFSLGFGTPLVVAQAVTAISKWGEKISELLTKLCETMRRVSPLLGKLAEVFTKIIKVLGKLAGKATGLDVISTKNIKAGGFFHRGGSGGGAGGSGGSGGGHHGGSGDGDAEPGSPSGSRRSNGSDNADGGDGPNSSHNGSDGSDTPGDHSGGSSDSGGRNGSDSPSSDSPSSPGSHSSAPDGTGPSTIDTATSSTRRGSDSPGGSHPDSSPSTLAGDSSPTSRSGNGSSDSSYSPQSSPHSDGPSSVSAPSTTPHSSGAPHSGGSSSSGGGTHSGGNEPSPHHSSSNDSTSASGYAPPRTDAPSPQSAPPQHIRSNDGGGSAPNQSPAGGGIPQQGGGGSPTSAPAGGGSPSPRPSGGGWTGTPGSRAPEVAPNRVPDGGPSGRRPSGGPSTADGGGPSRTPDRSGPGPQRTGDGGSSTPQRTGDGSSAPQRTGDGGSSPRAGDSTGRGGSSPQRPADSSSGGPQRPGDGGEAGQPKRPGTEPGLGRSEPAPTSGGGSPASANRGSGDGSAPPAAAVATGPGGAQRGPEAGGGARRPDGSPEPVARGGARTDAPPAKPGETPRTGKESPAQNGKPQVDEPGKPKDGGKPENAAPDKKPGQHDGAENKPGSDASEHKPEHAAPEHQDPKHHDSDGSNHHDDPGPDGAPPHHDEPLSPDEVNHRHAEDTPAGSSYHRGDPELGDLPHRVQPDPDGRYTVDVHVTADGHARIGDRLYTPEEFADVLRHNGNYDGRPIRLIGCDAGSNDFAHRLSRDLDTEVLAPSKPAWTDSHGRVFSSDYEIGPDGRMRPRIPPDGEWAVHRPDGTAHHVGDDGFAPDGKHHDPHDIDADSSRHRGEDGDDDDLDWRDRPGPDGRTPRENLADPEYIKKHYYEWTDQKTGRTELRIRHSAVDPENPPHPVDLVDGKPVFKHDRPAAEFMGYDDARSGTHAPQRGDATAPEHNGGQHDGGQHQGDHAGHDSGNGQHDQAPAEQHVPGTHSDTSNWREKDYDAIDQKVHDRETKYHELNDTPKDSPEWKDAHNAKNDASEKLGEEASGHAVRDRLHREFTQAHPDQHFDVREHPDAPEGSHRYQIVDGDGNVRADITPRHPIDGEKPGAGNFDHIWEVDYHNGGEPHYIVHEAKGPGGQPSTRYVPEDMRTYRQGHPKYFDDIVKKMAHTDPDLADALERAKLQKRLDYVEVRALVDQTEHTHKNLGYAYKPFNGYDYQSPLTPASGEE
ncbi:hypothetical protein CU254_33015 [Amycolatopsis sp. AA4]|uniref:hypothetical protein n=1 Tax=Actinomycetes TaxID=1760 RepID=UPI0001B56BA6|nr:MULTISPECIES: hypothetical protein [Actinomycetes]ATY14702.1 hypothetical protein CU254_33015 [Amycolatopsis sp. AA4]EFL10834.1 predicted protein [Streptomyces sp. AA4]